MSPHPDAPADALPAPPLPGDGKFFVALPDAGFRRVIALKNDGIDDTLRLVALCGAWMEAHGIRFVLGDDRVRSYVLTVEQMHRVGQAVATAWRGIDGFAMLQPPGIPHGHGAETATNRGVNLRNFLDEEEAVAYLESLMGERAGPVNRLPGLAGTSLVAEEGILWLRHRQGADFGLLREAVEITGRVAAEQGMRRLYVYDGNRSEALSPEQMLASAHWAGHAWKDFERVAVVYPQSMRRGDMEDEALRQGCPMRVFGAEPEALAWVREGWDGLSAPP